ncbi:MAG: hypothetical protein FWF45_02915, partial [Coriobacteriia bacterium]|nr:hypothetical protein [Coriobacteriia bacterium]
MRKNWAKNRWVNIILTLVLAVAFVAPASLSGAVTNHISVTYQTHDQIKGYWLPNVVDTQSYAGNYGNPVDGVYASLSSGNIYYTAHQKGGYWLPEVKNRTGYAGNLTKPIDGLMVRTDTGRTIHYRVHLQGGAWLDYVSGYNASTGSGYAGIIGKTIDAIQIYLDDPVVVTPPPTPTPAASTLAITSVQPVSQTITAGSSLHVGGTVKSNYKITSVTVSIKSSAGVRYTRTEYPNATSYSVSSAMNNAMMFSALSAGATSTPYTFTLSATDGHATKSYSATITVKAKTTITTPTPGFVARTTRPAATNKWYYSTINPYYTAGSNLAPTGNRSTVKGSSSYGKYVTGNCTWYAWGRAAEILGAKPKLIAGAP